MYEQTILPFPRRALAWEGCAKTRLVRPGEVGYTRHDLSVAPVLSPSRYLPEGGKHSEASH